MKTPDLTLLGEVFQKYPEIQAVYLFGSVTSGKMHNESDVDLGIVSHSKALYEKRLDILTDLARYGFCEVDIVFLHNTDDIVLKYEVVRQNKLVYQREDFDRGGMYSKIIRQYLDFMPYLEVQRKAYKRRILDGQNRGDTQTVK